MSHTEYMRKWRAEHPEYLEYMQRWRGENKERLAEYRRDRYAAHRSEEKAAAVSWAKKYPFEVLLHSKASAANNRYEGRITAQDIRELLERDGLVCYWCKKAIELRRDFTLEHLEPINDPSVLAIACQACNCARLPRWHLTARLERKEYLARRKNKKRAYDNQWRHEHREQVNACQRARYDARIKERRVYFREWQRKKRERDRVAAQ